MQTQDLTGSTPPAPHTQPIVIEEQFSIVADNAPVLIWISGADKLYYFFNQERSRFTGHSMNQEYSNGRAEGNYPDDFSRHLHICTTSFEVREKIKKVACPRSFSGCGHRAGALQTNSVKPQKAYLCSKPA